MAKSSHCQKQKFIKKLAMTLIVYVVLRLKFGTILFLFFLIQLFSSYNLIEIENRLFSIPPLILHFFSIGLDRSLMKIDDTMNTSEVGAWAKTTGNPSIVTPGQIDGLRRGSHYIRQRERRLRGT